MTEPNDPTGAPPAQPVTAWYPPAGYAYGQPGAAPGYGQPTAGPGYAQPGVTGPIQPPLPPPAPPGVGVPGDWVPPAPRGRGVGRAGLVLGAVLAVVLLLGGGFALGRTTAPSAPAGPASLMDALRMAQQGTLPCGNPPNDGLGVILQRLCRASRALPGGSGGPGGSGTTT